VSRIVIRGGLVITAADEIEADVLVEEEKVVALTARGSASTEGWTADQVIDAAGKYVIPGGVDAHTHMELPFGGPTIIRHLRSRRLPPLTSPLGQTDAESWDTRHDPPAAQPASQVVEVVALVHAQLGRTTRRARPGQALRYITHLPE
jgi:hypothetical protein